MKVDQKRRSTGPQKVRPPLPVWAKNAPMTRMSSKLFFLKTIRTWNAELSSEYPKDGKNDCFRGLFGAYSGKDAKNIEIRQISANRCYTVKMYISAHKTHPVRLRSDSGAVLSFLGLTGHDPGGFFRHPCSACTASGHDQLNVPTPIEAKYEKLWKPRKCQKTRIFHYWSTNVATPPT